MILNDKTPSMLLEALGGVVEKLFEGEIFEVEDRDHITVYRPLHVFLQYQPYITDETNEEDIYPQIEIKLIKGQRSNDGIAQGSLVYTVAMVMGIIDYRMDGQAWRNLMRMYDKLWMHFLQNPIVEGFTETGQATLEMEADDTGAAYFAIATYIFSIPLPERTDVNDMI